MRVGSSAQARAHRALSTGIPSVLPHFTHPPQNAEVESLRGRWWRLLILQTACLPVFVLPEASDFPTLAPTVMLHACRPPSPGDPMWQRSVATAGTGGVRGVRSRGGCCESAFSQQLAPHKAFITPKRLRLPKPERDKRCPFICNDVEAGGNRSELRGERRGLCVGPRGWGGWWAALF